MSLQPLPHLLVFVGCIVVNNQVQFQRSGRFPLDLFQEAQPLHMGVALLGAGENLPSK